MNVIERTKLVRAMELIARTVNDEGVFHEWLVCGVADGDIRENTPDDELEYYIEDEKFADLMDTFLCVMSNAHKSGGLYADKIVSKAAQY